MSGKRSATSELNHDNWNQEEEPEERGSFQQASENILKSRVIKTARRRNPIRTEDGEIKSAFVGFTGFSSKPPSQDFSFLKNITPTDSTPKTNGINKEGTPKSTPTVNIFSNPTKSNASIFGATVISTASTSSTNCFGSNTNTTAASSTIVPSSSTGNKKSEKYCSRLKGLNESVSKWIVKKVEDNPLISLQPIFKDYEKYLDDIEKEESNVSSKEKVVNVEPVKSNAMPVFNFNPAADKNTKAIPDSTSEKSSDKNSELSIPKFNFGTQVPNTTTISSTAPTFSFGSGNDAVGGIKPFSSIGTSSFSTASTFSLGSSSTAGSFPTFPTSTGFSFGGVNKSEPDKQKETESEKAENDEDEPPKVEFKQVVETDHVYTIRCKVFVKKGDVFGDRGVGNLYLKPIENSEKLQLIVRADTNLGNLLLNFILSESVPTKRVGKKDVMLVAIPTPDSKPPPSPILVRVKSPEDADKLLDVLEKHKK